MYDEQHTTTLANLYVASRRLTGAASREELLATVLDIVSNLLGSEDTGIYELDPTARKLTLIASMGAKAALRPTVELGRGAIGRAAETGQTFVAEGNAAEAVACAPLGPEDRVIGAIVIYELLPQKAELESSDRELLELIASQAAMALELTTLRAAHRVEA